ncbi:hypothetical protein RAC92_15645 [Agrobacterium sp. CR_3]|uniref:hypothetical protein n=1 Tax=unclassified Agrobacterium TaxID=2632611 RepID=UPI0035C1CA1E
MIKAIWPDRDIFCPDADMQKSGKHDIGCHLFVGRRRSTSPVASSADILGTVMSRTPYLPVIVMLFSLFISFGSAHADGVTVQHAMGEAEVRKDPNVVATLDVSALDTLYAIGVDVQGDGNECPGLGKAVDHQLFQAVAADLRRGIVDATR